MGIGNLGMGEILLILVILLLLFGSKRLPEVGRSLGRGIREFKMATREITSELEDEAKPAPRPRAAGDTQPREGEPRAPESKSSNA